MFSTGRFRLAICAWLLSAGAAFAAQVEATDTTLYRVFLRDGSTIVSYGEYARVGDRIVVSLPLGGSAATPNLQLLSLPADAVDWDKTDAYAESARFTRYAQTRGPDDFALLNEAVSRALNDIAQVPDPDHRIAMAYEARQNVTKWAAEHYGYRAANIAELAGLFDTVIAEARTSGGVPNFDLSLVANLAEPPSVPLLPLPTLQESVEQAFRAASLAPDASERTGLLRSIQTVLASLDSRAAWTSTLSARVNTSLATEERTDRAYSALARDTMQVADRFARTGNVTAVEQLIRRVMREDDRLGQRRPNETASVLAALDAQLDAARRLRLARDSFAVRAEALRVYQRAVAGPVATMQAARGSLDEIRRLAGPSRARLAQLSSSAAAAVKGLAAASVPAEAAAAHEFLRNAVTLAARAADGRLNAIASNNMQQAWDASSAAAAALMLFDRAADELKQLSAALRQSGAS